MLAKLVPHAKEQSPTSDQALVPAGLFRAASLLHAHVILEGAPEKDIVPATLSTGTLICSYPAWGDDDSQ